MRVAAGPDEDTIRGLSSLSRAMAEDSVTALLVYPLPCFAEAKDVNFG